MQKPNAELDPPLWLVSIPTTTLRHAELRERKHADWSSHTLVGQVMSLRVHNLGLMLAEGRKHAG